MTQAKISLKKSDGKISLKKVAPALKNIRLEFSWKSKVKLDADASALVCGYNAQQKPVMLGAQYLICYAIPADPERAVIAGADVRDGTGDKESITVDLNKVNARAEEIPFILTIYGSPGNGQSFNDMTEGKVTIFNDETNEALVDFDFNPENFVNNESLVHVASLFRSSDTWELQGFGTAMPSQDLFSATALFGGKPEEWYED